MAKRFADSQITRETHRENDSDSDEESTGHGVASAAVMSKRKIAMPKRKMAANFNRQPESTKENSSSAFGFLQSSASTGSDSDKNAKLKALNLQFKDKVISFVDQDPCADLSPVFEKYKTYIQSIGAAKPAAKPAAQPAFTIAPKPVQQVDDKPESSSDEEPEVKVEGPKFTIDTKPPTSDSVFSFGATKVAKKDDSDSDSDEVEIKGPQFTFSGTVKSDVFKLPKATEPTGEKPKDSEPKESEPEVKPAFSFGNSKQPSEKPAFSLVHQRRPRMESLVLLLENHKKGQKTSQNSISASVRLPRMMELQLMLRNLPCPSSLEPIRKTRTKRLKNQQYLHSRLTTTMKRRTRKLPRSQLLHLVLLTLPPHLHSHSVKRQQMKRPTMLPNLLTVSNSHYRLDKRHQKMQLHPMKLKMINQQQLLRMMNIKQTKSQMNPNLWICKMVKKGKMHCSVKDQN